MDYSENAVSEGDVEMLEVFVNLNASYKKTFNYVHQLMLLQVGRC